MAKRKHYTEIYPDIVADVRVNLDSIWRRIDTSPGPDQCWPCSAPKHRQGYSMIGAYRLADETKIMHTVHRLLLKQKLNDSLQGWDAYHTCGNMWCCNPAHLERGTVHDIFRGRMTRGGRMWGRPPGQRLDRSRNQTYRYGRDNILAVARNEMTVAQWIRATGLEPRRAQKLYRQIQLGDIYRWARIEADRND